MHVFESKLVFVGHTHWPVDVMLNVLSLHTHWLPAVLGVVCPKHVEHTPAALHAVQYVMLQAIQLEPL